MSKFVDYCNEIESARKHGFARVVLPAAISLPDICGNVEFPNKRVGVRYKKWVKLFLKGLPSIEYELKFIRCMQNEAIDPSCEEYHNIVKEDYDIGIDNLTNQLYELRNNITHRGDLQEEHYRFDLAYSTDEFPIQVQSFDGEKFLYGKPTMNLGFLIYALCTSAMKYYENADLKKKRKLDNFDKITFSSDFYPCLLK